MAPLFRCTRCIPPHVSIVNNLGVTIAGNMLNMYKTLMPASDLKFQTGIDAPTFMVENMTVAGI